MTKAYRLRCRVVAMVAVLIWPLQFVTNVLRTGGSFALYAVRGTIGETVYNTRREWAFIRDCWRGEV